MWFFTLFHTEYCSFIDLSTFRYCIQKGHILRREYCLFTALSTFCCCLQKHHNHFISCREYFPFVDLSTFHYPLQKQHHDHFISCREYCPFNDLSTFCHCLQKQLSIVCCICDIYYSMLQKVIPQFAGIRDFHAALIKSKNCRPALFSFQCCCLHPSAVTVHCLF